MAPEIVYSKPGSTYTNKCDIWSLGCVLYTLCTFIPPFYDEEVQNFKSGLEKLQYQPLKNAEIDYVVKKMLEWEPTKRPSCEELFGDGWV